jgi:mono/diheme cytochrome c family protein
MIRNRSLLQRSLVFGLALCLSLSSASAGESIPAGEAGYASHVAPFFRSFCVDCHGVEDGKAGIALLSLRGDLSSVSQSLDEETLEQWELVLEMLKSGEMPPADQLQPSDDQRRSVMKWIETGLREAISQSPRSRATASTRRLTNFEYQNTMRDLLGFELNLSQYLPEDPAKPYRFNNTAEFMLMGAEQVERYQDLARRAMASAIVDPEPPEVHRAEKKWGPDAPNKLNELAITGNRRGSPGDGLTITQWPTLGEYRIRIKASANFPEGINEMPLRVVMGYGLAGDIGNAPFAPVGTIDLSRATIEPQVYEFRGRIENHPWEPERQERRGGTRTGALRTHPANMVITLQNLYDDGTLNDGLEVTRYPTAVVESIEFEAPVTEVWPPEHHTRILFASPLRDHDPEAYVKAVLERFMARAFRRPVSSDEVELYFRIYRIYAADLETMEEAIRETLAVVLSSPNFLYHDVATEDTGRHYQIASRLAYFLWGSMPDQQLFDLAEAGQLQDPATIESQVLRMLVDQRANDFVRHFTMQWLSIAKSRMIPINANLFPRFLYTVTRGERAGAEVPFLPTIRDDMLEETVAFVGELIRRNASVMNLVDSDFSMLNQRLATHYGVDGVTGHQLRAVAIQPEHHLGGLLTQGSVLIGNSTGSAPHPIYRAVWLREAILGDEVKDPPADVPALSDSAGDSAETAVTIKDLLLQHRQQVSCNDCHARLDPWGIPFEHYNAIGKYQPMVPKSGTRVRGFDPKRDQDLDEYFAYLRGINTVAVDAESELPDGHTVSGLDDLKQYLLDERRDDIATNIIRRLLSYALGRELTAHDRFEVQALLDRAGQNDYKLQDIIVSICQSDRFLEKSEEQP